MHRSRIFSGGVQPDGHKTVWTTFFFLIILVLNLIYSLQRGSNGFITEKTILFQGIRGGPTFSRGGGSKCQFLLKPILLVILQGGPDHLSPLWIRTCVRLLKIFIALHRPLVMSVYQKYFFIFLNQTYVVGTQKNCLNLRVTQVF